MTKNIDPTKYSEQNILNLVYDQDTDTLAVSGGGASSTDGSTHTPASTTGTPIQGVYESSPTTLSNNQLGTVAVDANRRMKVTLDTLLAGEDQTAGVFKVERRTSYLGSQTADVAAKSGSGRAFGIFFAAASATPTCKIWDNTAASGTVLVDTFTPVAATFYSLEGAEFTNGLFVDIGGTVNFTVYYK